MQAAIAAVATMVAGSDCGANFTTAPSVHFSQASCASASALGVPARTSISFASSRLGSSASAAEVDIKTTAKKVRSRTPIILEGQFRRLIERVSDAALPRLTVAEPSLSRDPTPHHHLSP